MDLQWQDPRCPLLMPCGGSDAEQTGACHWKVIWDASSLLVRPGEPGLSGPGPNALLSSLPSTTCLWSILEGWVGGRLKRESMYECLWLIQLFMVETNNVVKHLSSNLKKLQSVISIF